MFLINYYYYLRSKIDSITIKAIGDEISEDREGLQDFYKFMISTIRSLCNAIEHFHHESAIFFPVHEHNYYEFTDYLSGAILLILPILLIVKQLI